MKGANNLSLVGTAGEYYVCAELCRLGFLALLTPKNNPLFDVVATNREGTRNVSVQVKTRSAKNKQGWKLSVDMGKQDRPEGLFVVLVNLRDGSPPEFYVYEFPVLATRVAKIYSEYIKKPKRDGTPRKEVGFRWFDEVNFSDDDRNRHNNWDPILRALGASH